MRHTRLFAAALIAVLPTSFAFAKRIFVREPAFVREAPAFELSGRPIGGTRPAAPTPAHLTGSRIMAVGEGALVIDADSGMLIKTDSAGNNLGQLAIGRNAGLLTFDPVSSTAYVADRVGDRIVAVTVRDGLKVARSWRTPVEPYGVALTPDRSQILVSTIADRTLVAYDAATGAEKWRAQLGREPRGIAVSPDGGRALVAYLATGTVDQVDLRESHRTEQIALTTTRGQVSPGFARAAFAVTFMGEGQAVVPFQNEIPVQERSEMEQTGSYGGGSESPITQRLAFVGFNGGAPAESVAQIAVNQPRAVFWNSANDSLFIAGYGNDAIVQIEHASQLDPQAGETFGLTKHDEHCGPEGITATSRGELLVWCAFSRKIARLSAGDPPRVVDKALDAPGLGPVANSEQAPRMPTTGAPARLRRVNGTIDDSRVSLGPVLVASAMPAKQHLGMVLFHSTRADISRDGQLACASCHPDNRADGLSWRIDKHELQTPLLSGRLVGTHPFKWDGGDKNLRASLTSTMKRLGGFGLGKADTDALAAYLEALPAVRTPSRDATAVARGKQLFDSEAGCRSCHDGPAYTDRERHAFKGTLPTSDTPSLLGLAASAPYFHDGSAATLEAVLRGRSGVHGMSDTAQLDDRKVADLVAFLETL